MLLEFAGTATLVILSAFQSLLPTAEDIYWTDWNDQAIKRINADGTGAETVIPLVGQPSGIAIDYSTNQFY